MPGGMIARIRLDLLKGFRDTGTGVPVTRWFPTLIR
jgi:hypothetical protein